MPSFKAVTSILVLAIFLATGDHVKKKINTSDQALRWQEKISHERIATVYWSFLRLGYVFIQLSQLLLGTCLAFGLGFGFVF